MVVAFGPVIAKSLNAYQGAGGGLNGVSRGILPAITTSYIGFNTNDGNFYPRELLWGWAPLVAVKAMSMARRYIGRI